MNKLEFETLEKSIELYKAGKEPNSDFMYVFNCEGTEFDTFDIHGDIASQLEEIKEYSEYDVTNGRDIYDEFTAKICPAYVKESA